MNIYTNTFFDVRDGNEYKTVEIGNQIWIAENLRYMPYVSPLKEQGGIWVYDYHSNNIEEAKQTTNYQKYGCLYDWETACKVIPFGWHLPTVEDWKQLEIFLGMTEKEAGERVWRGQDQNVGGKLKSITGWENPNTGATNDSGFSALPGGLRAFNGIRFLNEGKCFYSWLNTIAGQNAWYVSLHHDSCEVGRDGDYRTFGFSVRCVQ